MRSDGTWSLASQLLKHRRRFERIVHANWFSSPLLMFRRDSRKDQCLRTIATTMYELGRRYDGVMRQLFQRVHSHSGAANVAGLAAFLTSVLKGVSDEDHGSYAGDLFCPVLWKAMQHDLESRGLFADLKAMEPLKPKFMLRQFVDEMPATHRRGVLATAAFGERNGQPAINFGRETLHQLDEAYEELHAAIMRNKTRLARATDAAITEQVLSGQRTPRELYETWLFNV